MSEEQIEKEIQEKNLNAPRLNPALIDAAVKEKTFHVFGDTCLTVCCLTLVNGFTVTGESACASPENFNAEIGEKIAFEQARNKIWMLEGYLLKQKLFESHDTNTFTGRLYIEHDELKIKMDKLAKFMISDAFDKLPDIEKRALRDQLEHMGDYSNVLSRRISRTCGNA